jgi:hypothetical protein
LRRVEKSREVTDGLVDSNLEIVQSSDLLWPDFKEVFAVKDIRPKDYSSDALISRNFDSNSEREIPSSSFLTTVPEPSEVTHFLVLHSMNAVNAMFCISEIMQLTCSKVHRIYVPPANLSLPPSLKPTELQSMIPHHAYVDLFPLPTLRNRILEALQTMNEEELCKDICNDEWRIWGNNPWDPKSWELPESFVKKWWFLLDDELLRMTNYWRMQRSQEPLTVPGRQKTIDSPHGPEIDIS